MPTEIGICDKKLFLYDQILQDLKYFEVTDSTLLYKNSFSLKFDGQVSPLNKIQCLNSSLFIADYGADNTIIEDHKNFEHIALEPDNANPLFEFGEYPDTELTEFEKYATFLKTNASKPDGKAFIASYISAENRIKIYDSEGKIQKDIIVSDPEITGLEISDVVYRTTMGASDRFIYFLGVYGSNEKVYYEEPDSTFKTSIEIWNWDGEPVYRAYFDRFITGFSVSEKYGNIYGFSSASETEIYEYHLPEFITN